MDQEQVQAAGCVWGVLSLVFIIWMLIVGGHFRTEVTYKPPNTANVSEAIPFEESVTARHWLFGLIQGEQADMQAVLQKHVRPNDQLVELTVDVRHKFVDALLMAVTLTIYTPVTVTFRGKVAPGVLAEPKEKSKQDKSSDSKDDADEPSKDDDEDTEKSDAKAADSGSGD